jgi:hypothetical protein
MIHDIIGRRGFGSALLESLLQQVVENVSCPAARIFEAIYVLLYLKEIVILVLGLVNFIPYGIWIIA